MTMISPFAVVSPDATIGNNVEIGPFCLIEPGVTIGKDCKLASHVVIKSGVTVGDNNRFSEGSVIGGAPQHVSAPPPFGTVRIGDGNVFRENVTIHCSLKESGATVIGNENYLMVNAHIAHDCVLGNNNILVNNVMLGGHVILHHRSMLGGGSAIHQNCRVGSLAMIGGQAHVVQDIPPFMMVDGLTSRIVGLNLIGLRRNGRTSEEMKILKGAYFALYRNTLTWQETLQVFQDEYSTGPAAEITQFLLSTKRGIVRERAAGRLRVAEPNENERGEEITSPTKIRAIG
ncbi:MAG: acyl-ACP--UDP-N-acetylglucosamine O-acyltransferase [Planctomycetaceae bacterium]|jgi:UDP-N-acetylglucosamine acyltransferase|nr:acyl-ACP--UDP-N-acetylglucosamine O-acyltransferase [Planctomycetaceae bacterium]